MRLHSHEQMSASDLRYCFAGCTQTWEILDDITIGCAETVQRCVIPSKTDDVKSCDDVNQECSPQKAIGSVIPTYSDSVKSDLQSFGVYTYPPQDPCIMIVKIFAPNIRFEPKAQNIVLNEFMRNMFIQFDMSPTVTPPSAEVMLFLMSYA